MLLAIGTYHRDSSFVGFLTLTEQRVGNMVKKENVAKAGGYVGIITAAIAYYCGLAEMLTSNDIFQLPTGKVTPRRVD
jgi:succinate-acetate transporter protein